jgi:hypothetical protein
VSRAGRDLGPPAASGDLGLLLVVVVAAVPSALAAWAAGRAALARGGRRWQLGLAAGVAAVPLLVWQPGAIAHQAAVETAAMVVGVPGLRGAMAILGAFLVLLGRLALLTAPLGVPGGLAVALLQRRDPVAAEVNPARQQRRLQAELRRRKQARTLATRVTTSPGSNSANGTIAPLAVSISGDLPPSWRSGRYVVLPEHAARLPRLVIGQPGAGKSTYLAREAFLAGLAGRQLAVIDGKGERSFASMVVDAYTAGWTLANGGQGSPAVHLFPAEPLSVWQGGATAVVNRLVDIRPWSIESDWYRELLLMSLRLALGAPGEPVTSMAGLVERLDPVWLTRAWPARDHPVEAGLVKSMQPKLADVSVRVANLAAALGGALDGTRALGDADLTVVSLPTMGRPSDSEAVLRVLMADAQHWASVRKDPARPALLMVDEFSAVPGGRQGAINVLERGRSAGVPAILAGQSYASLGPEDERDRLVSAAGTVVLFASSTPDELVRLAGTVQTSEAVLAYESDRWTGRASVTSRARHKIDPNTVRQLGTGEAVIVAGGYAEHVQVIMAPGSQPALPTPRRGRLALPSRRP